MILIKSALKSLYSNKLRSFLAMLGIIIGVGAVISMLAIGAGAQKQVIENISEMGTNLLVVRSGQRGSRGVMSGAGEILTVDDAEAILEQVEDVEMLAPVVQGTVQFKYYNKNSRSNIIGSSVTYPSIRNYEVEFGRFFNDTETTRAMKVVVIGSETAENLGFTKDNIGEKVKINGANFKVIGMLKSKGDSGFMSADDIAMMPYTTAMNKVLGTDKLREIDIQSVDNADSTAVEEAISTVMRKQHKIRGSQEDDFSVRNQADLIERVSDISKTFTMLLGGIAAISLLVGGIGIMNIMLVTVTERTKEIGIRKAIGAKDRDILRQFLIESIVMTGLGGLFGVLAGVGTSALIGNSSDFSTSVEVSSVVLALTFSMAVGIFFGYYPAQRASKLDPIECLYYE
nr:ABC transporter permease [bacterium]